MALVSLAQSGVPLSPETFSDAISRGVPLKPPQFEGITLPVAAPVPAHIPATDPWGISASDAAKYKSVFEQQATDGVVTGVNAAALFTKSGLEKPVRPSFPKARCSQYTGWNAVS
jgi:hypothetical protein